MKNTERKRTLLRMNLCFILSLILILSSSVVAFAHTPYGSTYKMNNGGKWVYSGETDNSITKNWTALDWRRAGTSFVAEIVFLSPTQVKSELNKLVDEVGAEMANEMVKFGVETAVSFGIKAAEKKLILKYGALKAAKVIPYLSIFAWGYTAYDVISTVTKGRQLQTLTNAAKANKGLIHVSSPSSYKVELWDGSTKLGSYPNAKLPPNNWQEGKVTVLGTIVPRPPVAPLAL